MNHAVIWLSAVVGAHGRQGNYGGVGLPIGNYCTLVGVIIASNARVLIGSYSFLAHEVVIADDFAAAPSVLITAGLSFRRNRNLRSFSTRTCGSARAQSCSRARGSVPEPGAIVAGNPARIVGTTYGMPAA